MGQNLYGLIDQYDPLKRLAQTDGYGEDMSRDSRLGDPSEPGWGGVLGPVACFLVPGIDVVLFRKYQSNHPNNGLTLLRTLFMVFTNTIVLIGVVVAIQVNLAHFRGGKLSSGVECLLMVDGLGRAGPGCGAEHHSGR